MTLPIIGVTPSVGLNDLGVRTYSIAADYTQAIQRAGGLPIVLPLHITDIDAVLAMVDGLVFSGGGDIEPSLFHQDKHDLTDYIDEERDSFEITLMQRAFEQDVPILAICRGIQVMNVGLGGDLIQDIPSQTTSEKEHAQRAVGAGEHDIFQTAMVDDGDNPLTRALGTGVIDINSFHHQALGTVPNVLEVVAKGDDGIIEAVYAPERSYAIGTQWHPERLAERHAEHQRLFDGLVEAASRRQT